MRWEIIIKVAGEGGSITLYGAKLKDEKWIFTRTRDESALAAILDDEDLDLKDCLVSNSNVVEGWEEAIKLMGRSWIKLRPREVHPNFRDKVWEIVFSDERVDDLGRWEESCYPEKS